MQGEFNKTAALVIDVLRFAREEPSAWTAQDVQRRFSMDQRTAYRYMRALETCGCIRIVDPASGSHPALWFVHHTWQRTI